MRRSLLGLAAAAFLSFVASDASACCHKKKACAAPACAPAPVCAPAPTCAPAPRKKCHLFKGLGCHKKAAPVCAPAPCAAPCPPPCETGYAYAAPQSWAAPQGMPQVPTK